MTKQKNIPYKFLSSFKFVFGPMKSPISQFQTPKRSIHRFRTFKPRSTWPIFENHYYQQTLLLNYQYILFTEISHENFQRTFENNTFSALTFGTTRSIYLIFKLESEISEPWIRKIYCFFGISMYHKKNSPTTCRTVGVTNLKVNPLELRTSYVSKKKRPSM